MRRSIALAVAAALVLGWAGAGSADHDPNAIHACVKDSKDGASAKLKRFVDDEDDCDTSKYSLLTWNKVGPAGLSGAPGPQGTAGQGTERPGFSRAIPSGSEGADIVGEFNSITIGADGLPVASYYDQTDGDLKLVRCFLNCVDFYDLRTIDGAADVGQYTSITIGQDGFPIISYLDVTNSDLKVAHCEDVVCDVATTHTVDSSSAQTGFDTSITIGADGLAVVSYRDVSNGNLNVAHCSDVACSASTFVTADPSASHVGEYSSITIGSDGLPVVSYFDGGVNKDLKVAHCANLTCSSGTSIVPVDQTGDVGFYTSITIGRDGFPIVSYYDDTNDDLKVAHCADLACASSTTTPVANPGGAPGHYTSIAIGTDGLPVVSHSDSTGGGYLTHCSDPSCTAAISTMFDNGDVQDTSLTIGLDGLPLVAYFDPTPGDLWLGHCSNRLCTQFYRPR